MDSEVATPNDLVTDKLTDVWVNGVYAHNEPTHSFYLCDHGLFIMEIGGSFWLAFNDDRFASLINDAHEIRRIH